MKNLKPVHKPSEKKSIRAVTVFRSEWTVKRLSTMETTKAKSPVSRSVGCCVQEEPWTTKRAEATGRSQLGWTRCRTQIKVHLRCNVSKKTYTVSSFFSFSYFSPITPSAHLFRSCAFFLCLFLQKSCLIASTFALNFVSSFFSLHFFISSFKFF